MEAWDRDTYTRNMIENRRKKMKKGGIVFGPDGEIITGSTYKSPSAGGIFGGNEDEDKKKVINEPVKLEQNYRNFDYESPWEGTKYIKEQSDKK